MDDKQKFMAQFCKMMIKHSPGNIPHPMQLIEQKAERRLSTDGLISFHIMMKEWEKVNPEDKKEIAKLLILNSHDVVEAIDVSHEMCEESKDVIDFLNEHPEYQREGSHTGLMEELENLFDNDDE